MLERKFLFKKLRKSVIIKWIFLIIDREFKFFSIPYLVILTSSIFKIGIKLGLLYWIVGLLDGGGENLTVYFYWYFNDLKPISFLKWHHLKFKGTIKLQISLYYEIQYRLLINNSLKKERSD